MQVNQIYNHLFNREADVTGLTYWTNQINNDVLQLAEIATHLIWAAHNNPGSESDKECLANRTNAATSYTAEIRESTLQVIAYQPVSWDPWIGGPDLLEGKLYLSSVGCNDGIDPIYPPCIFCAATPN